MFTKEHFIWIAICIVLITGLSILSIKKKFSFKLAAFIMAGVALVSELSKIFSHMEFVNGVDASKGMVLDATALPFHLCSILIFAFFYLPFAKESKFKTFLLNFIVPIGLIGATLAILMATSGTDFTKPYAYQCFVYHAFMVWFAIYLIGTKQVSLVKKNWIQNIVVLAIMAISMVWVNSLLQVYDTNFWFVVRPPVKGLPLLNLNHGWFVYFLTLLSLGFIGVTLVHLPFLIKEYKNKKKEKVLTNSNDIVKE
ncbi:MAG: hypothetical protein ACI311_03600 [Bacilli bacterium]